MNRTLTPRFYFLAAMVLAAGVARLLPFPPNYTPVAPIALFAGAHFASRRMAFAIPLVAMLLSDLGLKLIYGVGLQPHTPAVYLTFLAVVGMGFLIRKRRRAIPATCAMLAASTLFFITTNFSVWAMIAEYPKTLAGLSNCYAEALPYLGYMVAGDLFYTGALFGGFTLAERRFLFLSESPAR